MSCNPLANHEYRSSSPPQKKNNLVASQGLEPDEERFKRLNHIFFDKCQAK